MFRGMEIIEVEPGTKIEDGDERLTVTTENFVAKGRQVFMTKEHVAALRNHKSAC
jgi:hypothetical protein